MKQMEHFETFWNTLMPPPNTNWPGLATNQCSTIAPHPSTFVSQVPHFRPEVFSAAPDRRALCKGQEVWQSGVEGHRINVAGCSAAEARLVWDQEVAGSNPATPTRLFDGTERDR